MLKKILGVLVSPISMAIVAVISLALAVYTGFYYEKRPELVFTILSNTDVLDVKEKVGKLDISYAGESLSKASKRLRILNLRIANVGNADILKTFYDENVPLGLRVSAGEIVEVPEVTGNDYFEKNVKVRLSDARTVHFAPVIIQSGEGFQVKVLVLASLNEVPVLEKVGVLAGTKVYVLQSPESEDISFWSQVLGGGPLVHTTRALIYLALLISIVTILGVAIPALSDYKDRAQKSKRIMQVGLVKALLKRPPVDLELRLLEEYIDYGLEALTGIQRRLERYLAQGREGKEGEEFDYTSKITLTNGHRFVWQSMGSLERLGLISVEKTVSVNREAIDTLNELVAMLEATDRAGR